MIGIDTETIDGRAVLACAYGVEDGEGIQIIKRIKNLDDVLKFLTECSKKTSLAFAYNMDYDAVALMKYFNKKALDEIYFNTFTYYKKHYIEYIPRKIFQFDNLSIYDLYQFYNMSLDKAGQKFIGQEKIEMDKESLTNLKEYLKNEDAWIKLENYCLNDARLCYLLGEKLAGMFKECGIKVHKFYSCGYIARQFFRKKIKIPVIRDKKIIDFVEKSYFGGRIEFTKRGYFKEAFIYDINSAYPFAVKELYDINKCRFSREIDKSAVYYFVNCNLWLKDNYILPIAYRDKNLVVYPRLQGQEVCISNFEYEVLEKYNLIERIEINKVLNIYSTGNQIFRDMIEFLYQERQKGEAQNYVYKIIMNSLYGKFAQRQVSFEEVSDIRLMNTYLRLEKEIAKMELKEMVKSCNCRCFKEKKPDGSLYINPYCKCPTCKLYHQFHKHIPKKKFSYDIVDFSGRFLARPKRFVKFANIIYASLITSRIRCLIWEVGQKMKDSLIGFMTDAIFLTKPLSQKYLSKEMGKFSFKNQSWFYVLGSGIYQHSKDTKFRGYNTTLDLVELAKERKGKSYAFIKSLTHITYPQVIYQYKRYTLEDLNKLLEIQKTLDVNFDKKRFWLDNFKNFGDSLQRHIDSKPLENLE